MPATMIQLGFAAGTGIDFDGFYTLDARPIAISRRDGVPAFELKVKLGYGFRPGGDVK